jgi:hypothetical protein
VSGAAGVPGPRLPLNAWFAGRSPGHAGRVFLLFTSRLGCLGSLLVSLVLTALLFVLFTML